MSNEFKLPKDCTLKDFVNASSDLASTMDSHCDDVELCICLGALGLMTRSTIPGCIQHCIENPSDNTMKLMPLLMELLQVYHKVLIALPPCRISGDYSKQVRELVETDPNAFNELMEKLFSGEEES